MSEPEYLLYRRKWTKTDVLYLIFLGLGSGFGLAVGLSLLLLLNALWLKLVSGLVVAFCTFGVWQSLVVFLRLLRGRLILGVTPDRLDYVPAHIGKRVTVDLSKVGALRVGMASQPGSTRLFQFFGLEEVGKPEGPPLEISLFGLIDTEAGAERIAREIGELRSKPYVRTEAERRMEAISATVNKSLNSHLNWMVLYVMFFLFGVPFLILLFMT
ncbi:hypothetical protein [Celeribacter neptunius]|uniref:Uncharacterized protein n=1 Tax=Celeribacter neptunius TaxID=588602 RepID=A0A1I3LKF8_9RHOB|nr:hypothetical protein [Celeribacter neptunius]SFI85231.1 hypothetical protein SAMN04487991_1065 [Celeribacter neptunius]